MQETLEIICIALQGYALVFQKREEYIYGVLYEHLSNINYLKYLQKHCAINTNIIFLLIHRHIVICKICSMMF